MRQLKHSCKLKIICWALNCILFDFLYKMITNDNYFTVKKKKMIFFSFIKCMPIKYLNIYKLVVKNVGKYIVVL